MREDRSCGASVIEGAPGPRSTIAAGTVQALRLTYQLRTNCLSVTTDRTTVPLGPWQKPRSPPGTAAYWGTAATKGTSAVVRSPDGVHAPRHGPCRTTAGSGSVALPRTDIS